jgi:hypothetical protein
MNIAMNFRKYFIYHILILVGIPVTGQNLPKVDTIHTDASLTHMFLNIEVPSGEMAIHSSGVCGTSFSRLFAADSFVKQEINTRADQEGNHFQTIRLHAPKAGENKVAPASNLRFSEQITSLDTYVDQASHKTEFLADPSMSTDLFVDLGVGASTLDLSGLSLNNVSVNSAFSNIVIHYTQPNLVPMKKMDIHAASADISLKNIEHARAQLISIQNDMGQTELIIGDGDTPESTIYLQSGVGSCKLLIDKNQPIKLTLKSGFFSTVKVDGSFEKVQKNIYTNDAFKASKGKYIKIICNIDFGSISVVETE